MPVFSNSVDAQAYLNQIHREIPPAKRARFVQLYGQWASAVNAKTITGERLASGGRAGIYSAAFRAQQDLAATLPIKVAALRAEFPEQADRAMSVGVKTGGLGQGAGLLLAVAAFSIGASGMLDSLVSGAGSAGSSFESLSGSLSLTESASSASGVMDIAMEIGTQVAGSVVTTTAQQMVARLGPEQPGAASMQQIQVAQEPAPAGQGGGAGSVIAGVIAVLGILALAI